jgi:hypothetical protein
MRFRNEYEWVRILEGDSCDLPADIPQHMPGQTEKKQRKFQSE